MKNDFIKDDLKLKFQRILTLKAIKDKSIETIEITFSGGGDDGDIDDVNFIKNGMHYANLNADEKKNEDIIKIITDWGWNIIEETADTAGDWLNNQGGYGEIIIDVFNKTYNVNYHQYTTEDFNWTDESLFH